MPAEIPTPPEVAFSREAELLVACSWIPPGHLVQARQERVEELLQDEPDWHRFLTLVADHGVQPQAHLALSRLPHSLVPGRVATTLREMKGASSLRSLAQAAELALISKRFAAAGIDMIPLKGVALSQQLYGDLGLRHASDLDVLVRPENLEDAARLLEGEGYRCTVHGTNLTPRQRRHVRENLYHLEFFHDRKKVAVELHWNLGKHWSAEQTALLFDTAGTVPMLGTQMLLLPEETALLFLCDHGARHRFFRLKWLADVARLFTSLPDSRWEDVLALARKLGLQRTVAHSALLVGWCYGVKLPPPLLEAILGDGPAIGAADRVYALLAQSTATLPSLGRRLGNLALGWQVLRLRTGVSVGKMIRPCLVAAADFHDFPLPDRLFFLYYPLRPVSWLWRYFLKK